MMHPDPATSFDLLALPDIGATIGDARPSFVLDADTFRPIFANDSGLAELGLTVIDHLARAELPLPAALAARLRRFAEGGARRRSERVPVGEAGDERLERVEMVRLAAVDPPALLLILASRARGETRDFSDGLGHLAGPERYVALFDEHGDAVAGHGDDTLLFDVHKDVEDLANSGDDAPVLKRAVFTREGERDITLIALGGGPEQVLIISRVPRGRGRTRLKVPPRRALEPVAPSDSTVAPALIPTAPAASAQPDPVPPLPPAVATPDTIEPVTEPVFVAAMPAETGASTGGAIRFVWQMDASRRFALISPELADCVGAAAGPRIGETWADLASRLSLDIDGRVGHAVAGEDIWGGLTVLWPVAGKPKRMPVELSAMPILDRDRRFEGFRGFGRCRVGDVLDDVTATGLRLVPADPEPILSPIDIRPDPATVTHETPPADAAAAAAAAPPAGRLSAPERTAFRQIAEALGVRMEGDDAPPAPPLHAPRQAAAPVPAGATIEARLLDRLALPCLVSGQGRVLHVNPAFLMAFDYEDLADFERAGGLDALFAGAHVRRDALTSDSSKPLPSLTKDGRVVPVIARLATVPWGTGQAAMLTLEPLAAKPAAPPPEAVGRAELTELRARVAEMETILDTATDGVLILDAGGAIVTANRAAEALFGVERADIKGDPLTHLLAPESRRAALDYLDSLATNGVASVLNDGREVIGQVRPDGLIPLVMTIGRIDMGESHKFCAVLRDITHWKKSEEELTAARRRAEEASLHKSDFLAKMSHEIRTPLNAIIGFSEVMIDERFGAVGNPRYRDYLRDIHASGAHIMSLINDLLDLSKVEAGKMDLRFEAVSLASLVGECVALMQPDANRHRIVIRASLPAELPAVVADQRSVRQIVLNLLSNAIKFTPAGGQVIVSAALEDTGEVNLRFRDTGQGMTEAEIQTALEPFRQLHTTQSNVGTGLGLPLTKALAEANRAAFLITSTPGQGTLVSITFPVNRVLAS